MEPDRTMRHLCSKASVLTFSALVMVVMFQVGHASPEQAATASRWLEKVVEHRYPREPGCWRRPWVCHEGTFPLFGRKMCCNNRCVDVGGDDNNCGFCGVRCPFSWRCCNGVCVDPKTNPFHCGSCNNWCAFGSLCSHGMCGYAQQPQPPLPHIPFPQPCKHSPPQPPPQPHYTRP